MTIGQRGGHYTEADDSNMQIHNQHANHVELLADFAEKRDKEFYALRNECNELKTIAFHLGEDKRELLAEVEKLRADLKESDEIREKLANILTRTAAALKGEPPESVWHSWHDLHECAERAVRQAAEARARALDEAIKLIEEYRIPVGNSPAGELASEWTRDALEEIRDMLLAMQERAMTDEGRANMKTEHEQGCAGADSADGLYAG